MIKFKGLDLNTNLLNIEFNKNLSENTFGTDSFSFKSENFTDFINIFSEENIDFLETKTDQNSIIKKNKKTNLNTTVG